MAKRIGVVCVLESLVCGGTVCSTHVYVCVYECVRFELHMVTFSHFSSFHSKACMCNFTFNRVESTEEERGRKEWRGEVGAEGLCSSGQMC